MDDSPTSTGRYDHHTSPLMSTPASHVADADGTRASAPWHPVNRVLFRFGLVYFCLWAPGYFVSPLFAGLFGDAPTAYEGACGAMVDVGRATFRNLMDPIRDANNLGCAGTTEAMLVMIVVAAFVAAICLSTPVPSPYRGLWILPGCRAVYLWHHEADTTTVSHPGG
jgi:hypothetical protein